MALSPPCPQQPPHSPSSNLNHDVIVIILKRLKYPPHLINLVALILRPSISFLQLSGAPPLPFESIIGVKQGCPLAPYLNIICYDLFISRTFTVSNVVDCEAYVDDLGTLLSDVNPGMEEIFF